MEEYPEPVTKQCTQKILYQMNNSFYKINEQDGKFDIGFFCYIKFKEKNIPIVIINRYIFDEEYDNSNIINVTINNRVKKSN